MALIARPQQPSSRARAGLLCVLGLACVVPSRSQEPGTEEQTRPNFVLILADDLGYGDLACYGNWHVQTPRLDRMAEEGVLLTSFYVNASVCSPSRAAFLSGKFPGRLGVHGVRWGDPAAGMGLTPAETAWLPDVLARAGYRTGHFGKWHMEHQGQGKGPGAYGVEDHRTTASVGPGWEREDNSWTARADELIFDEALRFLASADARPFYLNVWSPTPHTPIAPSQEQLEVGHYKNMLASGALGPLEAPTPMRQYGSAVTELDRNVGRLLDALDERGLSENTLVLFTSDNGPENLVPRRNASVGNAGPFRGRKRSLYDGGVRMPALVRWPGSVPANEVRHDLVSGVDWFATVLDLAQVDLPGEDLLDGDRAPVLFGGEGGRARPLYWEYRFDQAGIIPINRSPMLSLRQGNWKLLMNPDRSRVELYDLARDPLEVDNVASAHPDEVELLSASLMAFHRSLPQGPIAPEAGRVFDPLPWEK